jgi:uncharacterized YccA/Bax inhibitor family protein
MDAKSRKGSMANPPLEKQFGALPEVGAASDAALSQAKTPVVMGADDAMTIGGTSAKTAFLLILVLGAGVWGWNQVDPQSGDTGLPGWWFLLAMGVLVLAIVTAFKPQLAIITGPLYALSQGAAIGTISRFYEAQFEGIVLQAIMATAAVFFVMLVLFVTRAIKVTDRLRGVIIGATLGIMLFYLASFMLSLFSVSIPLVWDSGPVGIGFSVLIVGIAAFNLMLDFDLIERGVQARAPKFMEWFGAFALMVTIIWLYIEILRLIGKARN